MRLFGLRIVVLFVLTVQLQTYSFKMNFTPKIDKRINLFDKFLISPSIPRIHSETSLGDSFAFSLRGTDVDLFNAYWQAIQKDFGNHLLKHGDMSLLYHINGSFKECCTIFWVDVEFGKQLLNS